MKIKNLIGVLIVLAIWSLSSKAQQTNPSVTNVTFNISGTEVTVTYDVWDAEQTSVSISMEVSDDNGATYNYNFNSPEIAHGDIGDDIARGTGKQIFWKYATVPGPNLFKIKIIANDLVVDGGPCATPTVDYEGKTYHTVQIKKQCWLKENLNVGSMSGVTKYCYDDDETNCSTNGGLYTWSMAVSGICPTGWHIPTDEEFHTLAASVNNDGNTLKAIGQGNDPNGAGTNSSGFSALLSGMYDGAGVYSYLSENATFWSSTAVGSSTSMSWYLNNLNGDIESIDDNWLLRFSVRCVKN